MFSDLSKLTGPYSGMTSSSDAINFPDVYTLADSVADRDLIDTEHPILGVNGQGEPLTLDVEDESPHVLITGGSGGGKSAIARAIAAQALAAGDEVLFLDAKQHSHTWARELPGAHYADTLPLIGNALVEAGQIVKQRNQLVKEHMIANLGNPDFDESSIDLGPRLLVIFEEMNATFQALAKWTASLFRNSNEYNAVQAWGDITFMGRAAKAHAVAMTQFAGFRATGGSEVLENFNTRILVRYSPYQWRLVAGDCGKAIAAPEQPGRGYVCRAGKARETQFLYMTEREARAYVMRAFTAAGRNREVSA